MRVSVRHVVQPGSPAQFLLDGLRFFAALTVLVYHIVSYFIFSSPSDAASHLLHRHWYTTVLFIWSSTGYQAVMVFFVLSGFLIGSSVMVAVEQGNWSWKTYLVHRMTRLWVVLIPALALTAGWGHLQMQLFGPEWYFDGTLGTQTFLGNMVFLQNIRVPEFGGNGPLWSLSNEFWYYLLFPCAVLALVRRPVVQRIVYLALIILIGCLIGPTLLEYFSIWVFGALIAIAPSLPVHRMHRGVQAGILTLSVAFALVCLYIPYQLLHITVPTYQVKGTQYFADACLGLSFAFLIYGLVNFLNTPLKAEKSFLLPTLSGLAAFSYTLYLTHYPLLHFITAWLSATPSQGIMKKMHTPEVAILFCTASALLYAFAVSQVTERYTHRIRRWVLRWFTL